MSLDFAVETEKEIHQFVLFPDFIIQKEEKKLKIKVNEKFSYILNELGKNFTRFELEEFVNLKSVYAKTLYKKLKQYRHSGWWEVTLVDFRQLLDIPQSYKMGNIDQRVIRPTLVELEKLNYFQNLRIEKIKGSTRGNPVTGLKFTFKPEKKYEKLSDKPGEKHPKFAHNVEKDCTKRRLTVMFVGATQMAGKRIPPCKVIYNTVSDIQAEQQYQESVLEPPEAIEQRENKNKLAELLSGLFGGKK